MIYKLRKSLLFLVQYICICILKQPSSTENVVFCVCLVFFPCFFPDDVLMLPTNVTRLAHVTRAGKGNSAGVLPAW